jgi:hypothetical protein
MLARTQGDDPGDREGLAELASGGLVDARRGCGSARVSRRHRRRSVAPGSADPVTRHYVSLTAGLSHGREERLARR